eukprot:scaffold40628_cov63-Attheya_sp.AAC.1
MVHQEFFEHVVVGIGHVVGQVGQASQVAVCIGRLQCINKGLLQFYNGKSRHQDIEDHTNGPY